MSIGGETLAPSRMTLQRLSIAAGVSVRRSSEILEAVEDAVGQWSDIARSLDIQPAVNRRVGASLEATRGAARAERARRPRSR
jgi:hypothetical protein